MEHRVFKHKIILNHSKPFPHKHLPVITGRQFFLKAACTTVPGCLNVQWIALSTGYNHYPADSTILISVILFHWIVIYLVDSAIQHLNNQGQDRKKKTAKCFCMKNVTGQLLAHSVLVFYKKICLNEAKVMPRIHKTRCYDLLRWLTERTTKKIRDQHVQPLHCHKQIKVWLLCSKTLSAIGEWRTNKFNI